ncbi:hypothetical protein TPHA_0C01000 [Tetrapisispora phaffii CBS 4417]|uniref:Midasin n=1 Tax=Tetrapisispora phaffii (strain ATCC 24235 / CBS 4417 / NBRC 1672 / NRRL Y-8282 / UCD 70-5) TaxID=1071381 RepID=G8BR80_TETPH|nr:hypothetical protein TPHA_0C01000 [Tetrapisispora phaffii CBS 4417]CCE62256.1 hypothetical protein TPHA_0C01000 [Tetrapisispora phaffii CBS 4417]
MMLKNQILLDIEDVKERYQIYVSTFPDLKLNSFYFIEENLPVTENLNNIAKSALQEENTVASMFVYYPIFLDIASRWLSEAFKDDKTLILGAYANIVTSLTLITPLLDEFLSKNNEHFVIILQNPSSQDPQIIQDILLAYYRILYYDRDTFIKYINSEIIYALLNSHSCESNGILKILSVQILSILLEMSEYSHVELLNQHLQESDSTIGVFNSKDNVNYNYFSFNESNRLSEISSLPKVHEKYEITKGKKYITIEPEFLDSNVVSVFGKLIIKNGKKETKNIKEEESNAANLFVPIERSIKALRQIATLVQDSEPVMLLGASGSGKTFIVNELAKFTGRSDSIIKIHLGEQTDAKLLIGTYTSGEKPGTFEWRSGILTNAVKEGSWVLIEDIDKAPTEVLSILLTLLEKRELIIPSRGEVIKAGTGFQLISTVCITEENNTAYNLKENIPNIIGISKWKTINFEAPNNDELNTILVAKFSVLRNLIPKIILSYNSVKSIYTDPRFISLNKGAHARIVSVRDIVKLCHRLDAYFKQNNIIDPNQLIESSIYDNIFSEAIDCFVGAISEPKALEPFINVIGETLDIPPSRISLYLTNHVPIFENLDDKIHIGRSILPKTSISLQKKSGNATSFATTNHSLRLMEQIGVAIQMTEPVLLVGETGTGKTTIVQQMAKLLRKPITIINVSQQTESGDLLGGYKPVNSKSIAIPIQETFETLFSATFSMKKNERFYNLVHKCFNKGHWKNLARLWKEAHKLSLSVLKVDNDSENEKEKNVKKRKLNQHDLSILSEKWQQFQDMVEKFEAQSSSLESSFVFNFVEGSLVKAVRNGEWLLLDELNLALADTLENITELLNDSSSRSLLLSEKGDTEPIKVHPDFRIFGCMNPATDVGKRDLPSGIRSKFTEIYVHSPDKDITDLLSIIDRYIGKYSASDEWVGNDIAELYLKAKHLSEENKIVDGANQRPHFSIRTLTRTLLYVSDIVQVYGLRRSLYDGFCMSFLTLLDLKSENLLKPIIEQYTLGRLKNVKSVLSHIPSAPGPGYVTFKHFLLKTGAYEIREQPHYIITPFVEKNMLNLVRASSSKRFPILIQGPTSAGKTSMIKYLADITGHKFVRINNHEHTDLQEYLGTYTTDDSGKLSFKEGVLVEALRNGHWIVLDELNLAPTDVLEALNRLLDDNRELFIPETQEVIHPHPDFMLFATQNPPGLYGGRKILSRAFRNRFLELHFDDIPEDELEIIIRERCQIAPTYAKKIVEVYRQLSIERSASRVFEQKNGFATLRDLFRWALRDAVGYEQLAANGYMLLAERCRTTQDKQIVKKVLEKVLKVKLNMDQYYQDLEDEKLIQAPTSVVWTNALRRLAVLVNSCMKNNEPILLVGETGCGKTTIFQILSKYLEKELIILNAHQNTETGDILGSQRPFRNRSEIQAKLVNLLNPYFTNHNNSDFERMLLTFDKMDKSSIPEDVLKEVELLKVSANKLFEWCDGPLVHALKDGDFFLLDEISLADDSVLERLNSVLEPERSILLTEKGSSDSFITANNGFQFFATMNPGGDYGKKELSPALRNRFTEIWVPSMGDFSDVELIVESKLDNKLKELTKPIVKFSEWFGIRFGGGNVSSGIISLRDILAWVEFINSTFIHIKDMLASLVHGASMVFVDSIGTNNTAYLAENEEKLKIIKKECIEKLSKLVNKDLKSYLDTTPVLKISEDNVQIDLFNIKCNSSFSNSNSFNTTAPTTAANLMRVVRAMQVNKPILLEGSPGVGKTSLVTALSELTGNKLTRINLSEQTDLIDLFGSDVPGENAGEFVWRDAPFLRAMQKGEWVLLDEMNLASQSVLEGLNACLDHRGEAYIPELDKSFVRHPGFLVFAAQNPQYQGSGRKGLPKSFINRFSVVYVDMLTADDLLIIAQHLFPNIEQETCAKMIKLMSRLELEVCKQKLWGLSGTPWEFNLRDTLRWLKLMNKNSITENTDAAYFVNMIITQRFRTHEDREQSRMICNEIFGEFTKKDSLLKLYPNYIQINNTITERNPVYRSHVNKRLFSMQCNTDIYESVVQCVNNNWPLILVGPSNSGKTEIIRYLASIMGAKVDMFSLNSDIDSMDILGGYEQVDMVKKMTSVINDLVSMLKEIVVVNMTSLEKDVMAISICFRILNYSKEKISKDMFTNIATLLEKLLNYNIIDEGLLIIKEKINNLLITLNDQESVKFEWFDGLLVSAVEKGQWLILDNANLCSSSVLDRLNSLLEINGSLIINECSDEDGQPRFIKPHPNFRLFLTVDPKFGELSRAMRNRGLEIYLDDLNNRMTTFDKKSLGKSVRQLPLKAFTPCYLSNEIMYAQIYDTVSSFQDINIETLVTLTSLSLVYDIDKFSKNITNSDFRFKDEVKLYCDYIRFIREEQVPELMNSLVHNVKEETSNILGKKIFSLGNKDLFPIINTYLEQFLNNNETNVYSKELIYMFTCYKMLYDNFLRLKYANEKSQNGKINELNYLELSAAHFNNRNIKRPPSIPIYEFLLSMNNLILSTIKNEKQITNSNMCYQLWNLLIILDSIYASTEIKDEARLRVYKDQISSWIDKSNKKGINTESFRSLLDSFKNSMSLKQGQSINLLWDAYRKVYPNSKVNWKIWNQLINLSKKFDKVVDLQFSESYSFIVELRKIFTLAAKDILDDNTSDTSVMLSELEEGIESLSDISSSFLRERSHYFRENFDSLSYFIFNEEVNIESIQNIAPLTSLTTEQLIKLELKLYTYQPIFEILWRKKNDTYNSATRYLFTTDFIRSSVNKSLLLESFSGNQLPQTLSDAKLLLQSSISSSELLLENKSERFGFYLSDWILSVINLHLKSKLLSIKEPFIDDLIISEAERHFQECYKNYLKPAINILKTQYLLEELGEAWIMFGIGLLVIYAPDFSYDPAVHDYVSYDIFERLKTTTLNISKSLEIVRHVTIGDSRIYAENLIEEVPIEEKPNLPRVYRPRSSIDDLLDEWSFFIESTVSPEQVLKLRGALGTWSNTTSNRVDMFNQNTSHFLHRLSSRYQIYGDINDIFSGYIFSIKFGIDLLAQSKKLNNKNLKISPLWSVKPDVLIDNSSLSTIYQMFMNKAKNVTENNLDVEKILTFFMSLFNLHEKNISLLPTFNDVLYLLYTRWTLRRIKSEQEQQEKSSMFKYQDKSFDVEAEFKQMFPTYDGDMDLDTVTLLLPNDDLSDIQYSLAKSYMMLFTDGNSDISKIVRSGASINEAYNTILSIDSTSGINSGSLASMILLLGQEINKFKIENNEKSLDFYRNSSVSESQKAISVINGLWTSVNELLKQWPDHATLNELDRICKEFLEFPSNTPLARQIQKIEQIYTFVVEWEKYAASKVSLSNHSTNITNLIVSWRRLELSTWNGLFETENEKLEKNIGKWWFYLFEIIIVSGYNQNENGDDSYVSLLTSLNTFFTKTTYGEFSIRIQLTKAFLNHLKMLSPLNPQLIQALSNSIRYYEQFESLISEHILKARKILDKEMKEIILLASWKDVNIDALKQSSRRSHNSLYKIVHKYRNVISGDVQTLIEAGIPFTQKVKAFNKEFKVPKFADIDIEACNSIVVNLPSWNERSGILKDMDLVNKNMASYVGKISKLSFPNFKDLVKSYFHEAELLKSETPSTLTKENKKLIATLRNQKAKLFSDVLKELRRIGLKTNFRKDIHSVQSSATAILSNSVSFEGTDLENCDKYYFRIIDLLPRLRSAVSSPSEDIPIANIERGMAISENLVFSLLTIRSRGAQLSTEYRNFKTLYSDIETIHFSSGSLKHNIISHNLSTYKNICKWLPVLIDYSIATLKSTPSVFSVEHEIEYLKDVKSEILSNFYDKINANRVCDDHVASLLEEFKVYLLNVNKKLNAMKVKDHGFIYDIITNWLVSSLISDTIVESSQLSINLIDNDFRKLHTSIMVSIQKIMSLELMPITEDDDKWLQISLQRLMKLMQTLNFSKVTANMNIIVERLKSASLSNTESILLKSLIGFTMPLIRQYYKTYTSLLKLFATFYDELAYCSFTLATMLYNLAKNGFCSPDLPSEEKDDNNLQEGTGLGDGSGAQNNSKDIDQDEDLTEDAQTANGDKDNKDDDDKNDDDDAVDMEGDMAGDLEDLSDQQNSDMDDEEDDEELELDEEIDDLNDDDPNAIDEKMWDEEASENSKEKNSEQNAGPEGDDDDVEANEKPEDNNKNNESSSKDEDNIKEEASDSETNEDVDDPTNDNDGDDDSAEEDVGEQEDEVRDDEKKGLETNAPEVETMDLPEDINLDSDLDEENESATEESGNELGDTSNEEEDIGDDDNNENVETEIKEEGADSDIDEENVNSDIEEENNVAENDDNNVSDMDVDDAEEETNQNSESEDDLIDKDTKGDEENKEMAGENTSEGLDGLEEEIKAEDVDTEAAVQQQSGSKGEGSDSKNEEEQENIGSFGESKEQQQESEKNEDTNEASREEAKETLKQLGDSLKEFHRRRQEIKENTNNGEDINDNNSKNENINELEHVDGANTNDDTQAMGAANQEDVQPFNDDLAIDQGDEDNVKEDVDMKQEEELLEDHDTEMRHNDDSVDTNEQNNENLESKGGFIGEKKDFGMNDPFVSNHLIDEEKDDLDILLDAVDKEVKSLELVETPLRSIEESRDLWRKSEINTAELVARLGEQLRLILEPTLATKLRGDYKTGKRLNMKRIIPYIASQFRKDKIWLRRTKPSKRKYQIMIALDDSKSMSESKCVNLAFDSLCLVSKTLTQLESGGLSIVKFGETTREVHSFGQQFSNESGIKTFQWFGFQEGKTDIKKLVSESIKIFEKNASFDGGDEWKLQIVISDGICEDHETVQRLVRRARERKIMLVFVIIDGISSNESIMDMGQVNYVPDKFGNTKLEITKYLDTFPFEFYVVVHDVTELPEMLSTILRQYFSDLASS